MLFCTLPFLCFFFVVFIIYWSTPWHRARVWLLLAASFYFYASWSPKLATIVLVTSAIDYLVARRMETSTARRGRQVLLGISLVMNIGLLLYFKYANFFLRSLEDAIQAAGGSASLPVLQVIVPIGISFYTFEAINYTVDVYRRKLPAERGLGNFMLFILFFPHLVAGPIVRARDFLPQVRRRKRPSWARFHLGGQYILLGMFKKMVIADRMALFADPIFADPNRFHTGALWSGALAYALQVYCDFSGYTDIALGCAHLLGYKLAQNFNMPYISANIAEFWRRWHISLSTWMRDYLYIPMGGSRGSRWQTYRNLIVTMTLGGLWHGASWPFVVFGVIQGWYLIIHRAFRAFSERHMRLSAVLQTAPGTAGRIGFTFLFFVCSLVVFRSHTLKAAGAMLLRMWGAHAGLGLPAPAICLWSALALVALAHMLAQRGLWTRLLDHMPSPVRGFSYSGVLTMILLLAPVTSKSFIYFQF
jgi:alginate O-acetyltransferase complex protein AlgI